MDHYTDCVADFIRFQVVDLLLLWIFICVDISSAVDLVYTYIGCDLFHVFVLRWLISDNMIVLNGNLAGSKRIGGRKKDFTH